MPLRALGVFEAAERVLGLGARGGIIGRSKMAARLAQRLGGIGPRFGGARGRLFAGRGERFVAATQFLYGGRCRILPAGYQQSHGAAALAMIGAADDDSQIGGSFQFNDRKMHAMPRHVILEVAPRATLLEHHVNVDAGLAQLDEIRSWPKQLRQGVGCVAAAELQPGFIHLDKSVTGFAGAAGENEQPDGARHEVQCAMPRLLLGVNCDAIAH